MSVRRSNEQQNENTFQQTADTIASFKGYCIREKKKKQDSHGLHSFGQKDLSLYLVEFPLTASNVYALTDVEVFAWHSRRFFQQWNLMKRNMPAAWRCNKVMQRTEDWERWAQHLQQSSGWGFYCLCPPQPLGSLCFFFGPCTREAYTPHQCVAHQWRIYTFAQGSPSLFR